MSRIAEAVFRQYVAGGVITRVEVIQQPDGPFVIEGYTPHEGGDVFRLKLARGTDRDRTFTDLDRLGEYLRTLHVGRFNVVMSEVFPGKRARQLSLREGKHSGTQMRLQ